MMFFECTVTAVIMLFVFISGVKVRIGYRFFYRRDNFFHYFLCILWRILTYKFKGSS